MGKLTRFGIDQYLIGWTRGFFFDLIKVLEVSVAFWEVHQSCGVLQGSLVFPILLLLTYISDLFHDLQRVQRVNRQAFADDLFLWIVGIFHNVLADSDLMRAMGMVERWSFHWLALYSVRKCECMLFWEKHVQVILQFEVFLYGERLPHVSELYYLGVWFDVHLTWSR